MTVLGLIPARKGSQRCPHKNIKCLGGKPLIEWTIDAAKTSGVLDKIVVSTDDNEVERIAERRFVGVIRRPDELAQASTPMMDVVHHSLEKYEADVIVLLQPTSPFRTAEDIRDAYRLFKDKRATSLVSVVGAPEDLAFEIRWAKRLAPCKNIVICNGAIYMIAYNHLRYGGTWYDGSACGYLMPKERSLDIDTEFDFEMARMMMEKQHERSGDSERDNERIAGRPNHPSP